MTYNITNISSSGYDMTNMLVQVNYQTSGIYGLCICLAAFLIILFNLKNYELSRAFAAASFITTLLAILLNVIGLAPYWLLIALIVMTAGSVVILQSQNG